MNELTIREQYELFYSALRQSRRGNMLTARYRVEGRVCIIARNAARISLDMRQQAREEKETA